MKYSPSYFRPLGAGDVGFTCVRQDDYVLGIDWWIEDNVKVYNVFSGFARPQVNDVRACRQALKSIDRMESRGGLSRLLWVKQQIYSAIEQIVKSEKSMWRFKIAFTDSQRQRVYSRLLRDVHWHFIDGEYYYKT